MKILITAGPTREAIDPVRYISNRSSGKMGYAIAEAAIARGHAVTLITGPVCIAAPPGAEVVSVISADEMYDAVHHHVDTVNLAVMTAAVADYKPRHAATKKLKKDNEIDSIELVPTKDILASLQDIIKKIQVVGFAAETDDIAANAQKKLRNKNCDLIIANDVSRMDTGFESDHNALTLYFKDGSSHTMERDLKTQLAIKLVEVFEQL